MGERNPSASSHGAPPTLDTMAVVSIVLSRISDEPQISTPIYVPDVVSEQDAATRENVPLIYLWNEDATRGTFSVSINGRIIEEMLEPLVPRDHAQFAAIRNDIMVALSTASTGAVVTACETAGRLPSEVFSLDAYRLSLAPAPVSDSQTALDDILEHIARIERFVDGFDAEAFAQDDKTIFAVQYAWLAISAAADRLGGEAEALCPDIAWHVIRGLGAALRDGNNRVHPDILWATVEHDLPLLQLAAMLALNRIEGSEP